MTVSHIVKVNHTVVERGLEYCWASKCWRLKCSNYKYLVLYPQILLFPSMTERQPHSNAAHSRGKSPPTLARWPASTPVLHRGLQRDIQGEISIQLCCEGTGESLRKKRYFQSFGFIYFSSATFKRLIKHYDYLFDNSCKRPRLIFSTCMPLSRSHLCKSTYIQQHYLLNSTRYENKRR